MSLKVGIFQFNGCDKCYNETLLLPSSLNVLRISNPTQWKPEKLDVAILTGYLLPKDQEQVNKIRTNAQKMISFGSCTTNGGIFGLAYQKGVKFLSTNKIIPNILEVHGCLGEIEELLEVLEGRSISRSRKECELCGRKSTCQYLTEVKRQIDLSESGDTCFNNIGYVCSGYVARECKEQCVKVGAPCRGCKPLVDRPGVRFLGMFGTLMANIEVASEATGKGGTDKLADRDDDVTAALPDIVGNFFRFNLPFSSLPIGHNSTTGNVLNDIMTGRLIEELPLLLGQMGGSQCISLTLDCIEAYETVNKLSINEKVQALRNAIRQAEKNYQIAVKTNNVENYLKACEEIRRIGGNMNLSRLYFGGFRTAIPGEYDFESYRHQLIEFKAGTYKKGTLAYTITDKGVITDFSLVKN